MDVILESDNDDDESIIQASPAKPVPTPRTGSVKDVTVKESVVTSTVSSAELSQAQSSLKAANVKYILNLCVDSIFIVYQNRSSRKPKRRISS